MAIRGSTNRVWRWRGGDGYIPGNLQTMCTAVVVVAGPASAVNKNRETPNSMKCLDGWPRLILGALAGVVITFAMVLCWRGDVSSSSNGLQTATMKQGVEGLGQHAEYSEGTSSPVAVDVGAGSSEESKAREENTQVDRVLHRITLGEDLRRPEPENASDWELITVGGYNTPGDLGTGHLVILIQNAGESEVKTLQVKGDRFSLREICEARPYRIRVIGGIVDGRVIGSAEHTEMNVALHTSVNVLIVKKHQLPLLRVVDADSRQELDG